MNIARTWALLCMVSASAASTLNVIGCGGETGVPDRETVATASDSIIGGIQLALPDPIGVPIVEAPAASPTVKRVCSGVMLSDRWLLTAKHCLIDAAVPGNITARIAGGGSTRAGVERFNHPAVDVALVRLNGSLLNPQGIPYANPLFLGKAASLQSKTLLCVGVGGDGTGPLSLRSANMVVSQVFSSFIRIFYGSGPRFAAGDSGAPCFTSVDGVRRVVSVHSIDSGGISADEVSIDVFRDWAQGIMGNAATVFDAWNFQGAAQALVPSGPNPFGTIGGTFAQYDTSQLLIGNNVLSSFMVPPGWRLNLFDGSGFSGAQFNSDFTIPAMTTFNDLTSSVRVIGSAKLFNDVDMGGSVIGFFTAGRYVLSATFDNQISSLRVPAGWRLALFDAPSFSGTSRILHEGSYNSLGTFNDLTSSVVVEEPAGVYVNPSFGGAVGKLPPGCFNSVDLGVPDDSISSVYVPAGLSVRLFKDANFLGANTTLTSNQSSLSALGFDDQVSSVCVSRI